MQLDPQSPPLYGSKLKQVCSTISSLLGLLRILVILYVITDYGNTISCTFSSLYGISDKLILY